MPTTVYKDEQGRMPSVTTILGKFTDPGGLMHWAHRMGLEGKDYRDEGQTAADRGTVVHEIIERTLCGETVTLGEINAICERFELDEEKRAQVSSALVGFSEWKQSIQYKHIASEIKLIDPELRVGGTADHVGLLTHVEVPALIDVKTGTGKLYLDHVLQVSAYRMLWNRALGRGDLPFDYPLVDEAYVVVCTRDTGECHPYLIPEPVLNIGWQVFRNHAESYQHAATIRAMVKCR